MKKIVAAVVMVMMSAGVGANGSETGHNNGNGHHHGTGVDPQPTNVNTVLYSSQSNEMESTTTVNVFNNEAEGTGADAEASTIQGQLGVQAAVGVRGEWRQVAPAIAPPLATGDCLGSASGGFNNGLFGLSGGKTYVDEGCNARRDAILLHDLGLTDRAILRLCQQPKMAEALGDYCPPEYHSSRAGSDNDGRWWAE